MATQIVPIACCCVSAISIIWIVYQCVSFVGNKTYQQHQAFKIRKKEIFFLTGIILILNLILRPILVSFSSLKFIEMNEIWRDIVDIAQMSLYAIIEYRCWILYYDLNVSTWLIDNQWKRYLNEKGKTENFCLNYPNIFGKRLYIALFFGIHGIVCVLICAIVERFIGFYPHRIICHFFVANILLFIIFSIRIYTYWFQIKHTYSHDMLKINSELNLTTFIMCITAICDALFVLTLPTNYYIIVYIVYQTILITILSIIILYLPKITIDKLLTIKLNNKNMKKVALKKVFSDADLYHNMTRFMYQEYSVENLLFISQWLQIQQIIKQSCINVNLNRRLNIDCNLMWLPSDIFLFSNNIMEAARAMYDKFVITSDILEVNIGFDSRNQLESFFNKYDNIRKIFSIKKQIAGADFELQDRTTTVVDNDNNSNRNQNAVKSEIFIQQLKDANEITQVMVQDMINAFSSPVIDCWDNARDSFERFQHTTNYKFLTKEKHSSIISIRIP